VLYLDSSALMKHYQNERGTDAFDERLRAEFDNSRHVFTSVLSYAEIHAIVSRRVREKLLSADEGAAIQDRFDADWVLGFTAVELDSYVLIFIRGIVKAHPLRGADAVHLASALWLRDMVRVGGKLARPGEQIIFASSDKQLITAAQQHDLDIFNPETEN
jgi:predicted nucleic acid-binding protein